MRPDRFLRTPVRGDHQARLRDLGVGEAALEGNPAPGNPYPQTLEVSFRVDAGVTEVQIAPLWEGQLQFVPDSVAGNPTTPDQVLESRFGTWSVVGDLVLRTLLPAVPGGHETAFTTHLPPSRRSRRPSDTARSGSRQSSCSRPSSRRGACRSL